MQQVTSSFSVELTSGSILELAVITNLSDRAMSKVTGILQRCGGTSSDDETKQRPRSLNSLKFFQEVEINHYQSATILITDGPTAAVHRSFEMLKGALNSTVPISMGSWANKLVIDIG